MIWLRTELARLEESVKSSNPRAIKSAVRDIRPCSRPAGIDSDIERILQSISRGEYEKAVSAIETMLG